MTSCNLSRSYLHLPNRTTVLFVKINQKYLLFSGVPGVHWRDPDLHEVIEFLNNPNNVIKANAAAYLQHLCYMDDPVKAKTRQLGGIAPLVALLTHDIPEIHRNACGALRYTIFLLFSNFLRSLLRKYFFVKIAAMLPFLISPKAILHPPFSISVKYEGRP